MQYEQRSTGRMRPTAILAIAAGFGVVIAAQALEGGTLGMLLRGSAALVVIGGTAVATLISYSTRDVARAIRASFATFVRDEEPIADVSTDLVRLSVRAHRDGLVAIEHDLEGIRDPFLAIGLSLAVDGVDAPVMKDILQAEMRGREAADDVPVRIVEGAAGYAPTFGILGAVLGLIQVMNHLATPAAVGAGIGVAFVATVYGLGLANLVLLPVAGRLRERATAAARRREMIADAVVAMRQRQNPRLVAQALRAVAPETPRIDEIALRSTVTPAAFTRISA